jgi:hypothetical protein
VPRNLTAGSEGERRFDLVLPGDEQTVHEVDAGRFDGDHDLTRARRRIVSFLNGEERGRAQLVADDRSHGWSR